ncbi:class I lanthipeptide [Niabella sp. W65]|nr:class I lanthipeptide [Niabella sp. W65]MCH7362817.1 class I lanthipeptide [Niabella sp. W65]ULT38773.1 class I lanthipeptide [Niabella sp. I65]
MKKKKINLNRLALRKEKVTDLNDAGASQIYGGATPTFICCSITCIVDPHQACGSQSADTCCVTQELGCM